MVDYNITGVQVPNFGESISNALAGRRADEAARQEAVVNQLKLQAWMQDRDYQMQQRHAAAANAAYEMKRRNELGGIMQGFGVTPAAVGRPGQSYSGTGVANDPYADIFNKLIGANFVPQAEAILKAQNEGLTGKKIGAETTKIGAETQGVLSENDKKATEARAAQFKEYGDAILRAGSVPEVYALIDSHAQALTELGIPPEQAKKNFVDAYQKNGGDANLNAFAQTLMQSSQGAAITAKHFADIAQTNAQTYQANAAGNKSMGELTIAQSRAPVDIAEIQARTGQANATAAKSAGDLKLAQDKQAWEQANPDYTLQETAQGLVAVNKKDPTNVKLIQINGETAMPFNKATTIPAGYRMTAEGNLEPIPGGPADAKALAAASIKLEPGQRMTPEGNIEDVVGSKLYVKNSKAHAGDAKNVQMVNSSTDTVLKNIDGVLDPKKASDFDANFGYGSSFTNKSPGARDVKAKLDSIKSALKEAGLQLFRSGGSIGQMTEKEWPIVEQLIASLDNDQSPNAARRTMGDIKARLDRIRNITNDTYDSQWGATQYHRPELTKKSTAGVEGGHPSDIQDLLSKYK